jgi:hypothetical protein
MAYQETPSREVRLMSRKLITGQPSYTLLVANLKGGSDPSKGKAGNPVKARTGITYQHFPEVQRVSLERGFEEDPSTPGVDTLMGHVAYTADPVPVPGTTTITVADNDFSLPARLNVGGYILVSGEDFTVAGSTALTAVELAAAIDALPEFTAPVPGGAIITVTGPPGPGGNDIIIEATYDGVVQNLTLVGTSFTSAEPTVGPPIILP